MGRTFIKVSVCIAVSLLSCVQEMLSSKLGWDKSDLPGFPRSLQANSFSAFIMLLPDYSRFSSTRDSSVNLLEYLRINLKILPMIRFFPLFSCLSCTVLIMMLMVNIHSLCYINCPGGKTYVECNRLIPW
jgi:hypothetical protein